MAKFILYLPYSEFIDKYIHKALGAIPIGFRDIGFDSQIIVGKMESDEYRHLDIKIHETNNLDSKYVVTDNRKMHIVPRLLNFLNFNELIAVFKILRGEKPDIIIAFNNSTLTGPTMLIYILYCKIFKVKSRRILKLDNDGSELLHMNKLRKKLIYLYYVSLSFVFQRIITETTCGYKIFMDIPRIKNRLRVIPNSVSNDFLKRYDEVNKQKNVITVSRITPDKGLDILIKAFAPIVKTNPNWTLEIIGEVSDPGYYQELLQLIDEIGISERVKFPGLLKTKQLIDKYRASSIFCLASRHESFAISRLEAISLGMYVITTTAGCAKDFREYGAHIVPIEDIKAMERALRDGVKFIEYGKPNTTNNKKIPSYSDLASLISDVNF